ncbi:v-type proton atpase subunit f [Anaeramoeba flamelloides]|uniref:V-type proton ATPase subunit F n=1 Tax=Anaeramoeba flamelloides TaxID=1746091 RepID=A0AAV7Y7E3_9EUKA|nr:v-type proton atpase subunit f [Anaeramoeba flamelloides]KAJ3426631.1 v-type proton atpase subunit f [Anaeramoeba flamelloides]KAJ3452624.1 v-type proton atpase subunit f [Anaeramoeba flamelloides]KAJ6233749.1 v-type proton atpase subunit f [Anaeramoeba flamelloides]KAJ6234173.1 v-type proton atpase subunit f [Anaeramoeba flamelloides]
MSKTRYQPREDLYFAIIGDRDTVTGFLLTGMGNSVLKSNSNFLVVDQKTSQEEVEQTFHRLTNDENIAIIIINQTIANTIRHLIDSYEKTIPTVIEIPSKNKKFDFSTDYIMGKLQKMLKKKK